MACRHRGRLLRVFRRRAAVLDMGVHDTTVTEQSLQKLRYIDTLKTVIVPKGIDVEKLKNDMRRVDIDVIPRVRP